MDESEYKEVRSLSITMRSVTFKFRPDRVYCHTSQEIRRETEAYQYIRALHPFKGRTVHLRQIVYVLWLPGN